MNLQIRRVGGWTHLTQAQVVARLQAAWFVHDYDQIDTHANRLEILDLAIPAFLDAVPNFKRLRRGMIGQWDSYLDGATQALQSIPRNVELWDWVRVDRNARDLLERLFRSCLRNHIRKAGVTKMLHLKRPLLIPIIDSQSFDDWGGQAGALDFAHEAGAMADVAITMAKALGSKGRLASLDDLRKTAWSLGEPYKSLSRLRLYDIVAYPRPP